MVPLLGLPAKVLLIVRMLGHRDITHAGTYARGVHGIEESITADAAAGRVDHHRIEVVAVPGVGLGCGGQRNRQIGERVVVELPQLATALSVSLDPRQLVPAERCLQIHHVVFEAALNDLVMLVALVAETVPDVLAHSVQRQH